MTLKGSLIDKREMEISNKFQFLLLVIIRVVIRKEGFDFLMFISII